MKKYYVMIVGPATRDVNIDYTGEESRIVGGAVTFCTPAAAATGAKVFAAIKANPQDEEVGKAFRLAPEDMCILPSAHTTEMRNEYFTADREKRKASCPAQSDPVLPGEIPPVSRKLTHLAGLLYGDFPNELMDLVRSIPLSPGIGASLKSLALELRYVVNSHALMMQFIQLFRDTAPEPAEADQ